MIKELESTFRQNAMVLGDYQAISKTDLANGYCDADEAGDEVKRSAYFAALMLRYWFKIFKFYEASKTLKLELADFVDWLSEALMLGFQYRRWRDPDNPLSKDPNGPDKVFNRACDTIRVRKFYEANLDKHKINYLADSIERQVDAFGDSAEVFDLCEQDKTDTTAQALVNALLANHKVIASLIVDGIVNQDTFKTTKTKCMQTIGDTKEKYYRYSYDFSQRAITNHLKAISQEQQLKQKFINYFKTEYSIDDVSSVEEELSELSGLNSTKLNALVKTNLEKLATDKMVRKLLCI